MAEGKEPSPDQQQKPGGPKLKMSRGVVSWLVFIGVALMLLVMLNNAGGRAKLISIDEFWTRAGNGEIDKIVLRDDSAMNLSPELVEEFILPHDGRLLEEFGGGAVHFCGRGDHYIERLSQMRGLHAVNMSQPECNDLGTILEHTAGKGINLIGLDPAAADRARRDNLPLNGRVHANRKEPPSS